MRLSRTSILLLPAALSALLAFAGCQVAASESGGCDGTGGSPPVTGTVTKGKEFLPGTAAPSPLEVDVRIQADVALSGITIGTVNADLSDANLSIWKANLYATDLEQSRIGDEAVLDVTATDLCGGSHPIDTLHVPLGPAPGVLVSDLSLSVTLSPSWECSLPADQSAPALVEVHASKASAGAVVTLQASQGTFTGGMAKLDLTLLPNGDDAAISAYFLPATAGAAVLGASAKGALAKPMVFPVVDKPAIDAPAGPLARDAIYSTTVRSRGNLVSCSVEQVFSGAATVEIVDPPLGVVTGSTNVKRAPVSCAEPESLTVTVTFATGAPDGAAVTLRCFDGFNQEGHATFAVAKAGG
jgi:hypothetical protein